MTTELDARKVMLNGRKTERIIFAVTPELKKAIAKAAEDKCVSVSAYITALLADDVIAREVKDYWQQTSLQVLGSSFGVRSGS